MSNGLGTLGQRWREAPRAIKWAIVAGVGIAAYFGVIERAIDAKNAWNGRADSLQRDLSEKTRIRQATADSAMLVEQATGVFGRPSLPEKETDRVSQFDNRINKIFAAHKVQNERKITRDPRPMPQDAPPSLVPSGMQLAKLEKELSFETDMATLTAILKEIEQAPEVASVSRVVLRRQQNSGRRSNEPGPLSVSLTVEAWATTPVSAGASSSRVSSANGAGGAGR